MQPLEHPGLVIRSLDPNDTDEETAKLLSGWFQAVRRGFHQGRGSEDGYKVQLDSLRKDDARLLGAWPEHDPIGDGTMPVGTFCSWAGSINVGRGMLPLHMISDVTVAPTHRRQGLLTKLMTANLAEAADAGLPLAALTVSEATIYGRYGFGPAADRALVEVDVTSRFRFRPEVSLAEGSMVLAEPADAWKTMEAVHAAFLAETRGAVSRPAFYEPMLSSSYDFEGDSAKERRQRVAVHLTADGTPDGYVQYALDEARDGAGLGWLRIVDLLALSPATYLRLWRFLADIDLVDRVAYRRGRTDEPLGWALTDRRAILTSDPTDYIWIRVLDVPRALGARPWYADGQLVLGIDDPLGHAAGQWSVVVRDGSATVARTEAPADVTMAADTLGSLYLGGVDVPRLAKAGRLTGTTESIAALAALADGGPAPYSPTGF